MKIDAVGAEFYRADGWRKDRQKDRHRS